MIDFGTTLELSELTYWVRIWPDGTWCIVDEYHAGEYSWKSDDYIDLDMYDYWKCRAFPDQQLLRNVEREIFGDPV